MYGGFIGWINRQYITLNIFCSLSALVFLPPRLFFEFRGSGRLNLIVGLSMSMCPLLSLNVYSKL